MRKDRRGFTLIELMIVVAIIGVLAILAVVGVRKYLGASKSAEATNNLGAMNRAAMMAFEKETAPSQILIGATSQQAAHNLCASAGNAVPGAFASVQNRKYTPATADNADYHTGNTTTGWKCLKYEVSQPQSYQYTYAAAAACNNGLTAATGTPGGLGWVACAEGDLNGAGPRARFTTGGRVSNGQAVPVTQIAAENPED